VTDDVSDIDAIQAAELIGSGQVSSEELVQAYLKRIDETEETIRAWTHLDQEFALEQARAADAQRRKGGSLGPLHGVPVGIKDIFDTADMPTEDGTVLHAGRRPKQDATAVSLLRAAGAVILGKTATTELAVFSPAETRNPHDTQRTPGGSSSGSAAAVAAGMVPLSVGTQTNGSIIRPAAFCGVCGYKPSHGLVSRHGVLPQSRALDHVGVFGRTVEDVAMIAAPMIGFDKEDPDTRPTAPFRLLETARQAPPVDPRLAFIKTPVWDQAEDDTREGLAALGELLGEKMEECPLPDIFNEAIGWHRTVHEADLARSYRREYQEGKDRLSTVLREMIERGQDVTAVSYNDALYGREFLQAALPSIFKHYDTIITPAAPGQAPVGLESTGSPVFCTLWTFCGTPAISLPLLQGADGMPIGVQLVGPPGDDERLLRTARWLAVQVAEGQSDDQT